MPEGVDEGAHQLPLTAEVAEGREARQLPLTAGVADGRDGGLTALERGL